MQSLLGGKRDRRWTQRHCLEIEIAARDDGLFFGGGDGDARTVAIRLDAAAEVIDDSRLHDEQSDRDQRERDGEPHRPLPRVERGRDPQHERRREHGLESHRNVSAASGESDDDDERERHERHEREAVPLAHDRDDEEHERDGDERERRREKQRVGIQRRERQIRERLEREHGKLRTHPSGCLHRLLQRERDARQKRDARRRERDDRFAIAPPPLSRRSGRGWPKAG